MSASPSRPNLGVAHGAWGEAVAMEYLRRGGYEIFDRNSRPCRRDGRLEIDIVAYDRRCETLVFVEVKQHRTHSPWERRLRSVDRSKLRHLRTACRAWMRRNGWHGAHRFDVIEVYGEPGMPGKVEIDHVARIKLFADAERFVNWND